jgi:hypothetical protein
MTMTWIKIASLAFGAAVLAPVAGVGRTAAQEPRSNAPFSCHTSGSGATAMNLCVSQHGNLVKFEAPAGVDHIGPLNAFKDGYAICTGNLPTIPNVSHGYDTGGFEAGFGAATIIQPNGPNTLPLTITRDTTNGIFSLTQKFSRDPNEQDWTITMTLKNLSSVAQQAVKLQRAFEGDADNNTLTNSFFGRTLNSVFEWVDQPSAGAPAAGRGLMLTALTWAPYGIATAVNTISDYNPNGPGFDTGNGCIVFAGGVGTPSGGGANLVGRVVYGLDTINAGKSKTVKVAYRRM